MSRPRSDLWGPIAGIVFVVLFVVGFSLFDAPSGDDSVSKITSFYNDSGDRAQLIISSYLLILSGVFFIWFLATLRNTLTAAEGESGRLALIATMSGVIFTALLMVAAAMFMTVAADITFGDEKFVSVEAARLLPEVGYPILLIGGMFAAAAMIDATSIVILRTGVLPKWIAWFGFVAAIGVLFSVFFLPMGLLVLWVLFVSVALLRRRPVRETPAVAG